jgi:hypothetical protein
VRHGWAVSVALLAVIAFTSLVFTPFTEQYARESVPEEFWPLSVTVEDRTLSDGGRRLVSGGSTR